jgi:hypothetical protein
MAASQELEPARAAALGAVAAAGAPAARLPRAGALAAAARGVRVLALLHERGLPPGGDDAAGSAALLPALQRLQTLPAARLPWHGPHWV